MTDDNISPGVGLIAAERARQIDAEGYSPEHDDGHPQELANAAACYLHAGCSMMAHPSSLESTRRYIERDGDDPAADEIFQQMVADPIGSHFGRRPDGGVKTPHGAWNDWPWEDAAWKPVDDPIRNLVKAGALIAAEIDRLLRAQDAEG